MNTTSNEKAYFDLHTSGIGYLHRVREVPVKGGRRAEPFLACTITALVGPVQNPIYRYLDLKVSGAQAKQLVASYIAADDLQRPLVRFRVGDLWGDPYIRPAGERKGEVGASLKGRLLKVELLDRSDLADLEQYELITRGIGYLNQPREVFPRERQPFLACTIGALAGPVQQPDYRYIDTIVTSTEAQQLVRQHVQDVQDDRKVLIAFRLNDIRAEPYRRTKGERAGEAAVSLKSTLVHIGLVKVDGERVYPQFETESAQLPSVVPPAQTVTAQA